MERRRSRNVRPRTICVVGMLVVFVASLTATAASAGTVVSYRADINRLCRSFTPKFKRTEVDMTAAKTAGDSHRYAFDTGVMFGLMLNEAVHLESVPVPADARSAMAVPLRLLHASELQVRRVLADVAAQDPRALQADAIRLAKAGPRLNRSLDAAGLRDCGSNQS